MHAEAIWLPTTGKKTVVATDDRLCKGERRFFRKYLADIDFFTNCNRFSATRKWRNDNGSVKRAPFTSISCFRLCCSTFLA